MRRRSARDPYRLSLGERVSARLRFPRRGYLAAAVVVIGVVAAGFIARGGGGGPALLHGWQSGDLVGVESRVPGTCMSAYPPWSNLLTADQWIICSGKSSSYSCYRQRMHRLNFKSLPIRRSPFDSDCRAALAVLRKAGLVQ
ncbi:MAG TPA: hypothetical protein VNY33_09975 [Gaiellaceae bacterium]|nr:hypothetical protein [Gaiellaceae bacterium]